MIERYIGTPADSLKRDRGVLLAVLKEAGAKIRGQAIVCPLCDDKHPSAGIYSPNGDGIFRYKCHKCQFNGSVLDVIARLDGVEVAEVFKRLRGNSRPQPKVYPDIEALKHAMPYPVEAVYFYTDPKTTVPDLLVLRLKTPDGKAFSQARPVPGGFVREAPAKPWPLYNRARIQAADTIVVCEGEGKVHALHKYGVIGTTAPGGALKAQHADWGLLAGKNTILWPDNDPIDQRLGYSPGRKHMAQVEGILQQLKPACRISILEPADLDLHNKEDCVDFISRLETLHTEPADISAAIHEALSKAKAPMSIAESLKGDFEDIWSGKTQVIPWPWTDLSDATQALVNGVITILCGAGGAGKSLMLIQSLAFWHDLRIKVAVLELENGRKYHLKRAIAQISGDARVASITKSKEAENEIRAILDKYKDFQNSFGKVIYELPDDQLLDLDYVADWIEARAREGCRIISVDPVTVIRKSKEPWIADNAFLLKAHRIAKQYRCSIILTTHPTKNYTNPDMSELAGGADYARQAKCIIWLENHHEDKASKVSYMTQPATELDHDLTLHILKASDSWGAGLRMAYRFDKDSLTLKEEGIIQKKGKK